MRYAISANEQTIDCIQREYCQDDTPWYIGFSGGKDSSALLKLVFLALIDLPRPRKQVTVIYCDTGVEIPIISDLVHSELIKINHEAQEHNIPIQTHIVSPPISERFFSLLIGRGYPPPTNKFRWCTDRLRINPVNNLLCSSRSMNKTVVLGIRKGESVTRDRIIKKHDAGKEYYFKQNGKSACYIFAPLINYSIEDVWATIAYNPMPKSIEANALMAIYKKASGECPIIRDPHGQPCGQGRFGCWTCTVVRKDKSMTNLVDHGHKYLGPLLDFRNWLVSIRDDQDYRASRRRNGDEGPGPFTIYARKAILSKLEIAQNQSGYELIDNNQLDYIKMCWDQDKGSY